MGSEMCIRDRILTIRLPVAASAASAVIGANAVLLGTDANARLQLIAPAARIAAAQIIDFFMLPILSFSKASIAFQLLFTWESLPFRSFDFIIMTVFSVCSYEFHPG